MLPLRHSWLRVPTEVFQQLDFQKVLSGEVAGDLGGVLLEISHGAGIGLWDIHFDDNGIINLDGWIMAYPIH